MRRHSILALSLSAGLLLAPGLGRAADKTVQIFIDGIPTAVVVPDDFEMYEVAAEDIDTGNNELLRMAGIDRGGDLAMGYAYAKEEGNKIGAEKSGQRPNGVGIDRLSYTNEYEATNWLQWDGQYLGPDAWNLELDQSNARWSLDS